VTPANLPRITYLTAGAAGMFCGSCMNDNTLARALLGLGVDVQLVPMYTPIRTDEEDVSGEKVFFGGINVYLQQRIPLFRFIPRVLDRVLDRPSLLRWATSRGIQTDPKELGALTVSMLRGTAGSQRKEVRRLCSYLAEHSPPDVLVLTNALVAGCVPELKSTLKCPVLVTLQGDDIFLDSLPEPFKSHAFNEIRRLSLDIDGFLAHSRYYAEFMADYLDLPAKKFHQVLLGIDVRDFSGPEWVDTPTDAPTDLKIGYLARIAPEKGLHNLVDAFIQLKRLPHTESTQLVIAGWLGEHNRSYAEQQLQKLQAAELGDSVEMITSVDRRQKLEMLQQIDILSVPTSYREPKGLYVLEAMAAGVPVVQPAHGAFPELIEATGGGRLVPPEDPQQLTAALHELLIDHAQRQQLARRGRTAVHQHRNATAMAKSLLEVVDVIRRC
jgi:glycosyltransferase involved in cell wall biosynthesis